MQASRDYCRQITRRQARNFYYGLRLLPPEKRDAVFALYAYMRLVDDIADDDRALSSEQRHRELESWRLQTHSVLSDPSNAGGDHLLWPSFTEAVRKYSIPLLVFDEVIAGQRQDLDGISFDTFEQLHQYCYRVAGVVGLACIHIWGFTGGEETQAMALDRGVAFQLTNILRDIREDSSRGRLYLPKSEMDGLYMTGHDLTNGQLDRFAMFMRMQIERAESYYKKSAKLESRISADCRPTLVAMTAIYHGLLEKVSDAPQRVLQGRVSLSLPSKLLIGWRAMRAKS